MVCLDFGKIDPYLNLACHEILKPKIVQQMYGIRRYLNGSWLSLHLDTVHTHVISVILQIDQDVDQDWPLFLIGG